MQKFSITSPGRMILLYRFARVVRLPREILIKSGPPKGKATPQATGKSNSDRKRNEKESGKVGGAGKGKRESEEPGKRNCTARFDRESDTKESDR
ncbi:hypothetical protein ACWF9X_30805, partial [Streptomyces globisporus]